VCVVVLRLLLLRHDNAPRVGLVAVHDVLEPALDGVGERAAGASLAHGDGNVRSAVVDQGHRAYEVLRTSAVSKKARPNGSFGKGEEGFKTRERVDGEEG
jgi:hypothetical protein